MRKLSLSVAVITRDEEERLPDCLASVFFASDLVVVDSGSSDRTVEIAEKAGARVFDEPWRGFGPQKQFAIDQCLEEWVLVLDADERIAPETADEIQRILADPSADAYSLPRRNMFSGRWIRHMGWWPDRVVRLFKKSCARMSDHRVHESVHVEGRTGKINTPIIHLTNRDLHQTLEKVNRYSSIGAADLFRDGKKAGPLTPLLRGGWAFFHNYFIRLGFLDGSQGFVVAVSDGMNKFFKYAKLNELNNRE